MATMLKATIILAALLVVYNPVDAAGENLQLGNAERCLN